MGVASRLKSWLGAWVCFIGTAATMPTSQFTFPEEGGLGGGGGGG